MSTSEPLVRLSAAIGGSKAHFKVVCKEFVDSQCAPAFEREGKSLNRSNFYDVLTNCLEAEMATEMQDIRQYDIPRADIKPTGGGRWQVAVEGLLEKRPSVVVGDYVDLLDVEDVGGATLLPECKVVRVDEQHVHFLTPRSFQPPPSGVQIRFLVNKNEFAKQRRAVADCSKKGIFFDREFCLATDFGFVRREAEHFERWKDEPVTSHHGIPLNPEQQDFINVVLHEESCPRVCLLWGPPGTGKSTTVAALLRTMMVRKVHGHNLKALVCTPSNFAADSLTLMLSDGLRSAAPDKFMEITEHRSLLRVVARSRLQREVDPKVLPFCLKSGPTTDDESDRTKVHFDFRMPSYDEVLSAEVIICTLSTAATLLCVSGLANVPFDYIVVDEAAQTTEPLVLNALQFCTANTRFVLAGDHKQLGPVVHCGEIVAKCKFDISPMERLMRDDEIRESCAVMLDVCYRCHPHILALVNLHYDGKLEAPPDESQAKWKPTRTYKRFQMCHIDGQEVKGHRLPSIGNHQEVDSVIVVILAFARDASVEDDLLRDCVVLSPYLRQVRLIREALANDERIQTLPMRRRQIVWNIPSCTIEAFQGKEAAIVIVSTVRSCPANVASDLRAALGFVYSPKRLNVAVSRAKDHLFIVGNFSLLLQDEGWRALIIKGRQLDPDVFVNGEGLDIPEDLRVN